MLPKVATRKTPRVANEQVLLGGDRARAKQLIGRVRVSVGGAKKWWDSEDSERGERARHRRDFSANGNGRSERGEI